MMMVSIALCNVACADSVGDENETSTYLRDRRIYTLKGELLTQLRCSYLRADYCNPLSGVSNLYATARSVARFEPLPVDRQLSNPFRRIRQPANRRSQQLSSGIEARIPTGLPFSQHTLQAEWQVDVIK